MNTTRIFFGRICMEDAVCHMTLKKLRSWILNQVPIKSRNIVDFKWTSTACLIATNKKIKTTHPSAEIRQIEFVFAFCQKTCTKPNCCVLHIGQCESCLDMKSFIIHQCSSWWHLVVCPSGLSPNSTHLEIYRGLYSPSQGFPTIVDYFKCILTFEA